MVLTLRFRYFLILSWIIAGNSIILRVVFLNVEWLNLCTKLQTHLIYLPWNLSRDREETAELFSIRKFLFESLKVKFGCCFIGRFGQNVIYILFRKINQRWSRWELFLQKILPWAESLYERRRHEKVKNCLVSPIKIKPKAFGKRVLNWKQSLLDSCGCHERLLFVSFEVR